MGQNRWAPFFEEEKKKPYYKTLIGHLTQAYQTSVCYPPKDDIFRCFYLTPFDDVRVVILGQDPYHEPNQAHGLSFSVNPGVDLPPSLRNIFQELHQDLGVAIPRSGDLRPWANRGVLLLNAVLTVEQGKANAHKDFGWQIFTDHVLEYLNTRPEPLVYILWGNAARSKKQFITNPNHGVIESAHPSPLAAHRGFFGSKPFSKANAFLTAHGSSAINWNLEE